MQCFQMITLTLTRTRTLTRTSLLPTAEKIKYQVKREEKGAIRELRKDARYLGRLRLTEELERDADRKRRVKDIESAISVDRGEAKMESKDKARAKDRKEKDKKSKK